jgi:hypothetical protein
VPPKVVPPSQSCHVDLLIIASRTWRMPHDIDTLLRIRRDTLAALQALDGVAWQSATGELHLQNREMPNWIVLEEGSDPRAAHRAFMQVFAPYIDATGDVNVTVSYAMGRHQVAFFDSNAEIREALDDPGFGG